MTGDAVPAEMLVPRFLGGGEIGFVSKPVPEPGRGQLLIGVEANALCGSERGQFDRHVDELLDAFRRGEEPPVHARTGRRALELAYAAIESFETGERVTTV
jgi:threonine dehydrogenase-like Zn-dependent dehydrogenase